ncbi:Transcriptional regulator [Hoeflea phototrophica DFL-43]|jgi:DNA-binding MarR family transcriptional regulator|uniref:Transcriptional regulator n=1 Tax=Hoeflea phototrophica (strain DSM 17068 / NCIMB 14078 / DFL-43) TaxID=411684 RepID=A9DB28_HOEPD|nr:MarR family transcriptional regulator [Hoeflea phototrophica]EDQ32435.2 Transcriptional regulator [Hoeflea phototrophica DFL-43]
MTPRPNNQAYNANENTLALESFLPYRLARAAEMVSRQFAANYRQRYGLSRPEWRTLATIGQYEQVTATEICAHSSMHKTKVSRAIRALEQRNWINREPDTQDRRIEHISLTREGSRHYRDLVRLARDYEVQLLQTLGSSGAGKLEDGLTAVESRLSGW